MKTKQSELGSKICSANKDGSVSDITCENDPGYGICKEAIRVIKKTKKWIPALQNGNNVNAYRRQPIIFLVQVIN